MPSCKANFRGLIKANSKAPIAHQPASYQPASYQPANRQPDRSAGLYLSIFKDPLLVAYRAILCTLKIDGAGISDRARS